MKFFKVTEELVLTTLLVGLFYCILPLSAFAATDWQTWQGEQVNKKINDKINLGISYESRYQNSGKVWFTELWIVNPMYKFSKSVSAGPLYYYIPTKQVDGSVMTENRSGFLATYKWAVENFNLEYRMLYEYRDYKALKTSYENRVRHRIQVKPDINLSKRFLAPYFSYEIYYSYTSNDFMQSRTCVGDTVTICQGLKLSVQYLLRQDKSNSVWIDTNTFGTYLNYSF